MNHITYATTEDEIEAVLSELLDFYTPQTLALAIVELAISARPQPLSKDALIAIYKAILLAT